MLDLIINSAVTHSLMLALPAALAALLRSARCRGWAVLGGAMAGILLGPTILGRVAPTIYEAHFVGGVEERVERDHLARTFGAERLAAEKAGVDAALRSEMTARHDAALNDAHADWERATWSFQRPFRNYTAMIIVLVLLGGGRCAVRAETKAATGAIAPLSIGVWSAGVPGGLAGAAAMAMAGAPAAQAVLVGAAVAMGPWMLDTVDRYAADDAEVGGAALVQRAGRVASILALLGVAWSFGVQRGGLGLALAAPLLALPVGWVLPRLGSERVIRLALDHALVPSLAACAAMRIELLGHFTSLPIIMLVAMIALLSADGRWIGAVAGALIPGGRGVLRTMRLVLGSSTASVTQLAVTAIAAGAGVLSPTLLLALLFGAIYAELSAAAHRRIAHMLELIESEDAEP